MAVNVTLSAENTSLPFQFGVGQLEAQVTSGGAPAALPPAWVVGLRTSPILMGKTSAQPGSNIVNLQAVMTTSDGGAAARDFVQGLVDGRASPITVVKGSISVRPDLGLPATTSTPADQYLLPNTTYYWRVKATDNLSNVTLGPVWSFTTGAGPNPPNDIDIPAATEAGITVQEVSAAKAATGSR